jgi:hypothetical protein
MYLTFECSRISSTLEEDNLVIPVSGTIRLEKRSEEELLYLDIIYKNIKKNEWLMIKKPVSNILFQ